LKILELKEVGVEAEEGIQLLYITFL